MIFRLLAFALFAFVINRVLRNMFRVPAPRPQAKKSSNDDDAITAKYRVIKEERRP